MDDDEGKGELIARPRPEPSCNKQVGISLMLYNWQVYDEHVFVRGLSGSKQE